MTIHFAAAKTGSHAAGRAPACQPIARALACRAMERVANDDGPPRESRGLHDEVLRAALRHFAQHGLGAARAARAQAEAAFFAGDRQAYEWWLGITRTLDRRLAQEASRMGAFEVHSTSD
ncbi:MAG: hypothetical protein AAFR64_04515 [Pseudomonadota bacterium]